MADRLASGRIGRIATLPDFQHDCPNFIEAHSEAPGLARSLDAAMSGRCVNPGRRDTQLMVLDEALPCCRLDCLGCAPWVAYAVPFKCSRLWILNLAPLTLCRQALHLRVRAWSVLLPDD